MIFAIYCLNLIIPPVANAQIPSLPTNLIPYSTKVTATVPYFWWLELTGWTSPYAQVELSMEQFVKRITTASDQGQFTFRIALPRTIRPFCLIATDVSNISSYPLCLPPPPQESNILVKEVVMPPTLRIDKGKIAKGETVAAQGYTTPNSEVTPYLFEEKSRLPLISQYLNFLISSVSAAEVPKPPIKSNQNGFYQFNLPTSDIGKNRVFVGSIFLNNPSPKSTTLVFDVFPWWRMILEKIIAVLANLLWLILKFLAKPEGIIILEIGIIGMVGYMFVAKRQIKS